ncbi:phBC6A51 family helix-turn-helix protein [Paenibacillus glucanolyticus]|uniref:phBC6A51 family helix-turn-helix protein n=1 Tax=Paenibacillus glucanolyticus TaxID=59843 RepID=UPI00096D5443|nr:phBC6A51 family helix-turn-helix protein [Paenibacillus glucanolyticus]OMF73032.1 hypothetical protein BK142_19375 [Paenibacillus glucanolyticus]
MSKRKRQLESALKPQQQKAAQLYVQNEWNELTGEGEKKLTMAELAAEIGIARSTLFEWKANEDFNAYVAYLSDVQMRGMHDEFNRSVIKAMRGGNNGLGSVKAMELFAKLHGLVKNEHVIDDRREGKPSYKSEDDLRNDISVLDAMINGE